MLLANNNFTYISVNNTQANFSTVFTIDDWGVLRLVGSSRVNLTEAYFSQENAISNFKIENKYVKSFTKLMVNYPDVFPTLTNERGWNFTAQFGQLTIYYAAEPSRKIDYIYAQFEIRDSNIYDFNNRLFPATLFQNITYPPRCSEPRKYLDFQAPFVFVADPYWPIVSVYEQGGYKLFELSVSDLSQLVYGQNISQINYHHFFSPCPRKTFELKGKCVSECPSPYWHQVKGETGKCVLNCE